MEPASPDDSLFHEIETSAGPRLVPTEFSGGPWNPEHQHGGAVSGLLARALDRVASPAPMRLARITVEMFRAVPLRPLRVETRILRDGRRIQSAEAGLFDGERQVARATGLRIRRDESLAELDAPGARDPDLGEPPTSLAGLRDDLGLGWMPGFLRAVDIQSDTPSACGVPGNVWTRLRCRLVDGEDPSPVVRLATLADFASGTGNAMDYTKYTSINPDLTIHVLREPRSDWIGIRGTTARAGDGLGQSRTTVYDLEGEIAGVQATLLLDRR